MRKGQILVKMPLLLVAMVGFAALAVDVGFSHLRKSQVQGAAEAVALAAGYRASTGRYSSYDGVLPEVEAAAADLAALNAPGCNAPIYQWGTWDSQTGFNVPTGAHMRSALRVTVAYDQPRFFSALFDGSQKTIWAEATVVWTPYGDVWPMTIASTTDLTPGGVIVFGPETTNNVPGNKGWLSFNNTNNVPDLEIYLAGGPYTGSGQGGGGAKGGNGNGNGNGGGGDEDPEIPDVTGAPNPWVSIAALNQVSSEEVTLNNGQQGAYIWISGDPGLKHGTDDLVRAQCEAKMVVIVPIWDDAVGQGSHAAYKVVGLVPVQLLGHARRGVSNEVTARILRQGAFWFPAEENISQAASGLVQAEHVVRMVE
jgi:hypothetical protein